MIKVLFFLTQLGGGGAEMHFVRLSHELRDHGVEPIFATARGGGDYEKMLPDDVAHHILDTGSLSSGTLRLARSVGPLSRLIDTVKPDIVCPVLSLTTLPALMAAKRARHDAKVVLSIQNALDAQLATTPSPFREIQSFLTARLWPQADGVIALSQGVADALQERFPFLRGKMEVIYNIGQPIEAEMDKARSAPPPPSPDGRATAVACGRLTQQKDYPTMLRAIEMIEPGERPFLRILGKGELESELKAMVRDLGLQGDVEFLGFRSDVLSFMAASDLFVLSSRWEGFGNVIVEAMAMETAVISTSCPHGPDEIISDGQNGLLVPVGDPDALSQAMKTLLAEPEKRARIAAAGQIRSKDFDAQSIAKKYAGAFKAFHVNERI